MLENAAVLQLCPEAVDFFRMHVDSVEYGDQIEIFPVVAGSRKGLAYIPRINNIGNQIGALADSEYVEVNVVDLMEFMESLELKPTYLKLNIESKELDVLVRSLKSPRNKKLMTIAIEV